MNQDADVQRISTDTQNREAFIQAHVTSNSGSGCRHPRLVNPKLVQPSPSYFFNNNLHALIIGIDNYQNSKIPKLLGCVNDSENICRFLTDALHANPAHIKHLRDTQARRQDIISAFEDHLINNEDIQQNDAIVFYFAGHGSYEIPDGKYPTGSQIETICPYDDRMGARGIPDRTIAMLMRRLADRRGNNITAIFDSCHSGGMGRRPQSDLEKARYIPPPDSRYPTSELEDGIRDLDISLPIAESADHYAPCPPLTSHVLLAACQHDEVAYEAHLSSAGHHSGAFTTLLLDILREPERVLTETTYVGLLHSLHQPGNKSRLSKQTPYVEGHHKTRILFSTEDPGRYFAVSSRGGTFSVAAGSIHGVDPGTEFTVTSGKDRLENLKPTRVEPLISIFRQPSNTTLRDDARAEVTKWNQLHPNVFFQQAQEAPLSSQDYDLVIFRSPDGDMKLERRDSLIPRYADKVIPFNSEDAEADFTSPSAEASATIDDLTRFNYHLLRESESYRIGDILQLKLQCLTSQSTGYGYFPADDAPDLFTSGEKLIPMANMKKEPKVSAAVKLTDTSKYYAFTLSVSGVGRSLFPYVFGFDPSTYETAIFYHPENTKEGPLRDDRVVTIGYGPEGGDPIQFCSNEVTFFKVFVTTKFVDLNALVQPPVFTKGVVDRASRQSPAISDEFWESWVYVVKT